MPVWRSTSRRNAESSCSSMVTPANNLCINIHPQTCSLLHLESLQGMRTLSSHFSVLVETYLATSLLLFQSPDAVAANVLPESCTACWATTFISFSRDEKRCMMSWMRRVILRLVSIWARDWAEKLPGSSTCASERPRTEV